MWSQCGHPVNKLMGLGVGGRRGGRRDHLDEMWPRPGSEKSGEGLQWEKNAEREQTREGKGVFSSPSDTICTRLV